MSKNRQRSWVSRLEQLPQTAERRFTTQFHRIPQKIRFFILTALLSVLTTLLVSNYPIIIVPNYKAGDIAKSDVVAPVEMIVKDDASDDTLNDQLRANPVLAHAGEAVTAKNAQLIERVRQFQLAQRQPRRLIGLLALIGVIFFALYK